MSNKIMMLIVAAVVVVGGIFLFTQNSTPNPSTTSTSTGKIIFSVSDAAMDMSTISEVNMTVSSMSVHSESKGWVTVSAAPHTYKLLELNAKNESKVFADFQAPVGTYDTVRFSVDKIVVVTKAGATEEAKLPSGEMKINTVLVVKGDVVSSIDFDFLADKSLHVTGNGSFIFTPVVHMTAKSDAQVSVNTSGIVSISGGHIDSDEKSGMDIDGVVKADFEFSSNQKFDIVNDVIKLHSTSTLLIK